jgi:hypothetical protein
MELEHASKKEVVRRLVGRSKKEFEAILITKVETFQKSIPTKMVRRTYTNWFFPSLWDSIYAAITKHRNLKSTLMFLHLKYKLLWK